MGYSYGFQNGKLYGVDDINNIVSNFTSAGVSTYADLNGLSSALTNAGVTNAENSCKVIISGSELKIMQGIAFFSDGSTITIDKEGFLVEALSYIYFKKDNATGLGYPISSNTAPSKDDIPLAEYSNGVLTDVRKCAKSKINGFGTNLYYTCNYQKNNVEVKHENNANTYETYLIDIIPLENASVYNSVMMCDLNGKFIGYGRMKTDSILADYAYRYSKDGYYRQQSGGQASIMVYGIENNGDVYLSFEPLAEGIGIYLTTEKFPGTSAIDLNLKLAFC